jgi:hypothetical protein
VGRDGIDGTGLDRRDGMASSGRDRLRDLLLGIDPQAFTTKAELGQIGTGHGDWIGPVGRVTFF